MRLETQPTYIGDVSGDVLRLLSARPVRSPRWLIVRSFGGRGSRRSKVRVTELLSPTDVAPDQDRDRLLPRWTRARLQPFPLRPQVSRSTEIWSTPPKARAKPRWCSATGTRAPSRLSSCRRRHSTYLLETGSTPPQQPELDVWVDRRPGPGSRRSSSGPRDAVYVVRQGNDGKNHVSSAMAHWGEAAHRHRQRGSPLPDRHRRRGPARSPPQPSGGPPELDRRGCRAGGRRSGAGERGERAAAAPATMQSLGRLVLADYEAEALAMPGVLKASAVWPCRRRLMH